MRRALITGLAGRALSGEERAFLAGVRPAGIILFARNLENHDQIRHLVAAAHEAVCSDDLLVLIDQEGGRVQRLRPPLGRVLPPAAAYGALYAGDAAHACRLVHAAARLMAHDLKQLGINTDCAPVLDVPVPGAHEIIGDRAYGLDVAQIASLGRAVAEGLMAGSVVPVIKHIPGHGRATADSHLDLPVVATPHAELSRTDFATFAALRDMPAAMTAHVVFSDLDGERPASTSATVTERIMRGEIGFDGLLMSDDLGMHALAGPMCARAEAVIRAGSDVALHCSGVLAEMEEAAAGSPVLDGKALERWRCCLAIAAREPEPFDVAVGEAAVAAALAVA